MADTVNILAPQLMDLGVYIINKLYKGTSIWTPATRVGRHMDVAHWSAPDHIFGKTIAVIDNVSTKSDYNCKTDFDIWREMSNLGAKISQGVNNLWTQLLLVKK